MGKISSGDKKHVQALHAELKALQGKLAEAQKLEGKDAYVGVEVKKNQAHAEKIEQKDAKDKMLGKFYLEVDVTAKQETVFIPLSIASGKKVAGFMYQIEGTAQGSIASAEVRVRGLGVSQVTVGTLLYAKVPAGKTASFQIRTTIRGTHGKKYKIVFTRLNYKLHLSDARYLQYLKEISSKNI